jgi:membrane peptidoglycan carboxypeptidase
VNVTVRARQPGSAFKPIVYAAALERGWTPAALLWDIPYRYGDAAGGTYTPTNYDDRYRGPVRLRDALANSLNAATVGLASEVGLPAVFETAERMGIELDGGPERHGLSVALGAAEVRLLDLTAAYAALAAGGVHAAPHAVLTVQDFRTDDLLYVAAPVRHDAVSPSTAYLLTSVLSDAEARRPAFGQADMLRTTQPTAVKTGTSNEFRDNVTVGYTPYLAIGVWTGNKDGHPMRDVLGITGAAPIWHDSMEAVLGNEPLRIALGDGGPPLTEFEAPPSVARSPRCAIATLGVDGACTTVDEYLPLDADARLADAFAWYRVRAAAGGGQCSEPLAPGEPGGQIFLNPPTDAAVDAQVRGWAASRGILLAPPRCVEQAAARPVESLPSP